MNPMEQHNREYELLYIISASFTDEEMGTVEGRIKALIEKYGASEVSSKRLGKFRFTYPVKHQRHGHYVLSRFTADTSSVAKIDEALRISSDILRHLIVRADEVGSEKFDLVQFAEVSLDVRPEMRDDRRRREVRVEEKSKTIEEIKSGVAALEAGLKESEAPADATEAPVAAPAISDEELEKKIAGALEDNG